jgi:hypothetical protein
VDNTASDTGGPVAVDPSMGVGMQAHLEGSAFVWAEDGAVAGLDESLFGPEGYVVIAYDGPGTKSRAADAMMGGGLGEAPSGLEGPAVGTSTGDTSPGVRLEAPLESKSMGTGSGDARIAADETVGVASPDIGCTNASSVRPRSSARAFLGILLLK